MRISCIGGEQPLPTKLSALTLLLFLLLCIPAAATDVESLSNTTVLISSGQYIDEGLFLFIAAFAVVFFLISFLPTTYQDLISGIATILLVVAAFMSTRVAKVEIQAVLDPRIVNMSNMTVLRESSSIVHVTYVVQPEPLATALFTVFTIISVVNLIRVITKLYIMPAREEKERNQ